MLKLSVSIPLGVFLLALSCHVKADGQDGSPSLLYCDSDIRNFSLSSGADSLLMSGIELPIAIDYHIKNEVFFWSDYKNMYKAPLFEEGALPFVIRSGNNIAGLAVDWIHSLIYWTDFKTIDLARLDGSMVRTVIKEEGIYPWSIVLNPAEGFMFWSDQGNPKIERCNMDGASRNAIVNEDIELAASLAIDLGSQRIFWVDFHKNYLSSAKFDGSDRRNLLTELKAPFSVDVYAQHVYFITTLTNHQAVYKALEVDGSGLTKVFDGQSTLRCLKIFDPSKQSQGYNVCGDNNGGCSHLCLPTSGHTFSCACPNDRNMSRDNFNCLNSNGKLFKRATRSSSMTVKWFET